MDPIMSEWLNLIFRWLHVVAGILWIGHLYFFNFVNGPLAATYDADSKKKVIPELMPRALYFFRWGAAYTWISGVLLLGIVYYMGGALLHGDSTIGTGVGTLIGLGSLVVGFAIYEVLWKSPLAKNEMLGAVISFALLTGVAALFSAFFAGRAVFIHMGSLFGTIMAANVWMRIWPAQRKIIAAAKAGTAPDAAVAGLAKLRSKHNTYMSVPLVFFMVSNHFPSVYGMAVGEMHIDWVWVAGFTLVAWVATKWLYGKSASEAPKKF